MNVDYSVAGIFQESPTSQPWAMYNTGCYNTLEKALQVADSYVRAGDRILDMWITKVTYDDNYQVLSKEPVWHQCFLDVLGNVHVPSTVLPDEEK